MAKPEAQCTALHKTEDDRDSNQEGADLVGDDGQVVDLVVLLLMLVVLARGLIWLVMLQPYHQCAIHTRPSCH